MSLPPEVVFHRSFQTRRPPDQRLYRGKADLADVDRLRIHATFAQMLSDLQVVINDALLHEKQNVAEHVEHDPFHFDYVDSDVENALAFRHGGYSFIGVTIPLIDTLWRTCIKLRLSDAVANVVNVGEATEIREGFHAVLFRLQLFFVVSHEYSHHVHGHVASSDVAFADEIRITEDVGGLEQQTREADADGYATYLVLANLFDSDERGRVLRLLALEAAPTDVQDQTLLSCFVIAVAAFLFVRSAEPLDNGNIYRMTHPPQAARMNLLMHQAMGWCRQIRPELKKWMTLPRFQALMTAVRDAVRAEADWTAQETFLHSAEGAEYFRRLDKRLKAHAAAHGSHRITK